ncbi:GTPase Era [Prosthecochloris sp. SCSIO W1103]|uniref:GTPase Era n=1 Tax=Prosthecochloris sp. SCSIO W1103 TaxID=2992244 RepID=UPI00223D6845|nr:GTPase Era [Prosthecochloris sp. SCSIO W1103]UZJ38115.1 GTPase Era [Prosthecochloris sp. SCSIO W1103]
MPNKTAFACGYAAIVGPPNAGKSTLLNKLLNHKLSIVTPKPQTTRKKITGIYHNDRCQIIFLDTPGIMDPMQKLHESMLKTTRTTLNEADVIIALIPASKRTELFDRTFTNMLFEKWLDETKKPVIMALNKSDILNEKERKDALRIIQDHWQPRKTLAVSALHGTGIDALVDSLQPFLPLDTPLYPDDILSTAPERFFVSEIIREKVFLQYGQEIPYATEVVIDEFKEQHENNPSKKDVIRSSIIVERDSQKHILIGKKGAALKKLGMAARKDIEELLGRPVFLELFVKVRPDWRKKKSMLKSYGY